MLSPLPQRSYSGNILLKKMKQLFLFAFILFFNSARGENSRSPAVLDGTCNIAVATTFTKIKDGKEVVFERSLHEILKDQCIAIKKCMFSANDEEMDDLKNLEAMACNNNLNAITTRTPGAVVDKHFNGKRKEKFIEIENSRSPAVLPTVAPK